VKTQAAILASVTLLVTGSADQAEELVLIQQLKKSAAALNAAIAAQTKSPQLFSKETHVANPILVALQAQVTANTTAEASATTLINGIVARIQTAVDAAIAGGATAEDLAPVQSEIDAMTASAAALSAAVVANTPAPAPVGP
jgi:hypothetical protein